ADVGNDLSGSECGERWGRVEPHEGRSLEAPLADGGIDRRYSDNSFDHHAGKFAGADGEAVQCGAGPGEIEAALPALRPMTHRSGRRVGKLTAQLDATLVATGESDASSDEGCQQGCDLG